MQLEPFPLQQGTWLVSCHPVQHLSSQSGNPYQLHIRNQHHYQCLEFQVRILHRPFQRCLRQIRIPVDTSKTWLPYYSLNRKKSSCSHRNRSVPAGHLQSCIRFRHYPCRENNMHHSFYRVLYRKIAIMEYDCSQANIRSTSSQAWSYRTIRFLQKCLCHIPLVSFLGM